MRWLKPWLVLASLAVAGCSDPSRNLYEGIRNHNESMKTPEQRAMSSHPPSYDEYSQEREHLKNDGAGPAPEPPTTAQ